MTLTNEFFQQLEARFPGVGPWYVYAGLVFQVNDRMDLIASTWRYMKSTTPNPKDLIVKARKLREAMLKASVLVGFPKVSLIPSVRICILINLRKGDQCLYCPSESVARGFTRDRKGARQGLIASPASLSSRERRTREGLLLQDLRSAYRAGIAAHVACVWW